MGDRSTNPDHRRDIVDTASQAWINEFCRLTDIGRTRAAVVWSQHGEQLTPLDAAAQLGYAIPDDRLNMEGGRLTPRRVPEDAAEQSNRIPEANRGRLTTTDAPFQREHVAETWQREAMENDYSVTDELLDRKADEFVKIDKYVKVHDFCLVPNRTVGKKGATLLGWRVIEFARTENDLGYFRTRGEFAALDDAKEFIELLRSNEVLEALASGPGPDASHT